MRGEPASAHQCIRDCKCQAQSNYGQQHGHDCLTQPGAATLANRVGVTGEQRIISGVTRIVKGKRKKRRKKVVVPLRVRLAGSNKGSEPAYTLDANENGVKFAGFRGDLRWKTLSRFNVATSVVCSELCGFTCERIHPKSTWVLNALKSTKTSGETNSRTSRTSMSKAMTDLLL